MKLLFTKTMLAKEQLRQKLFLGVIIFQQATVEAHLVRILHGTLVKTVLFMAQKLHRATQTLMERVTSITAHRQAF